MHILNNFDFASLSPEIQLEIRRLNKPLTSQQLELAEKTGRLDLTGHYQHIPVAKIGPDGKIIIKEISAPR